MFGSEMLETIIGLAFIFTMVSLACSAIMEVVARTFNLRGKMLKRALRQILFATVNKAVKNTSQNTDPASTKNPSSIEGFYEHGLIAPMFSREFIFFKASPSYLPARTFAMVLIDKLLDYHDTPDQQAQVGTGPKPVGIAPTGQLDPVPNTVIDAIKALPPNLSELKDNLQFVIFQRDLPAAQALERDAQVTFAQLEAGINSLAGISPQLENAVKPLLTAAKAKAKTWEEAYDLTLTEFERWFDSSMDRVNGWYTRQAKLIIVFIAIVIVALFNIDALTIANALYHDASLRSAVTGAAGLYVQQANASPATSTEGDAAAPNDQGANPDNAQPGSLTIPQVRALVAELGVPIGWVLITDQCEQFDVPCILIRLTDFGGNTSTKLTAEPMARYREYDQIYPLPPERWLEKVAGLLVTVVAISMGAPFWFDILKKLVNVRAAGASPASTTDTSRSEG
jgi:hypothetical protein